MNNATKTIPQILRDNICTVFNALNLMIAIALAAAGAWKNILFLFIILINTAVGITQEIRAKRQIERLTLLTQPAVTVLRGGAEQTIRPEEIRRGDLMVLTADCTVQEGRLEVNEAILTGESEPVVKLPGDRILSGSSVISGRCLAQAECAADECFTAQMVDEVKKTKTGSSELLASMKRVTRFTSFLIVPLGVLLFVQAVFLRDTPVDAAVVAASAGLLGMLPKGLVLLISIGLAVGVIRLSKKNVLVRDLHSLENLAHCDVVCLDKTGTLTEGSLTVEGVYPNMDGREFRRLMATYLVHTDDNNSTYRALSERFSREEPYEITAATPFSSERKWSSVTLADGRTLVLGAPERLCRTIPPEAEALMAQGKRILFVGLCSGEVDTAKIDRIAMIVIADVHPATYTDIYARSLYAAEDGDMNKLEQKLIVELTALLNVRWWHRNIARQDFAINGFIKHYPDILIMTKSGKLICAETKGEHLKNDNSREKIALGQAWRTAAGKDFRYYMVFENEAP